MLKTGGGQAHGSPVLWWTIHLADYMSPKENPLKHPREMRGLRPDPPANVTAVRSGTSLRRQRNDGSLHPRGETREAGVGMQGKRFCLSFRRAILHILNKDINDGEEIGFSPT